MAQELDKNIIMQVQTNDLKDFVEMISINTICRLCANQSDKLIGIYSEDGMNNHLSNRINSYLPIKVSEVDQLPLQCCWQCASTVVNWHNLVVTSVEVDRKLRNCQFISEKELQGEFHYQTAEIKLTTGVEQRDNCQASVQTSLNSFGQSETLTINNIQSECDAKNDVETSIEHVESSLTQFISLGSYNSAIGTDNNILKAAETTQQQTKIDDKYKEEDIKENESNESSEEMATLYNFECEYCHMIFVTENDIMTHLKKSHGDELDFDFEENEEAEELKPKLEAVEIKNDEIKDSKCVEKEMRRKKRLPRISELEQEMLEAAKFVVEGKVYYKCENCRKTLHSLYTYKSHIRIHTGERPFTCHLCGKSFRVSQGLMRHIRETHERIKIYPCDVCGRMFTTRRNVEEHRNIHTDDRPYVCQVCNKAFRQKASLFVHKRTHTNHFPFKCSYCSHAFRTTQSLNVHVTRHTGEKPYPCEHCGRRFRIKYELKRHKLIHSDEKPYMCDICNISFRQKRNVQEKCSDEQELEDTVAEDIFAIENTEVGFEVENRTKTPDENPNKENRIKNKIHSFDEKRTEYEKVACIEKKYCNICSTQFQTKTMLKKHVKDEHNMIQPKIRRKQIEIDHTFNCSICEKSFTRKFGLQRHLTKQHPDANFTTTSKRSTSMAIINKCKIRTENGGIIFKCNHCGQTFKRSYSLMRHRTIHSNERLYVCHICSKSFRLSNSLSRHINEYHNQIKNFECPFCDKKFVSKYQRNEHIHIHTNNRPFVCDTCGKCFKQQSSLYVHKLFHSNNFRFQCNVCDRKFRRKQELKIHTLLHTGEKPYRCKVCSKDFRLRQGLKRHQQVHNQCRCIHCGVSFEQQRYLKMHLKIHVNSVIK